MIEDTILSMVSSVYAVYIVYDVYAVYALYSVYSVYGVSVHTIFMRWYTETEPIYVTIKWSSIAWYQSISFN